MRASLCGLLVLFGGCVTVDATLRSEGSGTFEMTYQTPLDATEFLERRRFSSPHVHVESVKIHEDQRAVLRATVDDVTRLSTAPGFAAVTIDRAPAGDDDWLTVTLANPAPPHSVPDEGPWLTLRLALPGRVREANRHAEITGGRVTWVLSRGAFLDARETVFRVRYRRASNTGVPLASGEPLSRRRP